MNLRRAYSIAVQFCVVLVSIAVPVTTVNPKDYTRQAQPALDRVVTMTAVAGSPVELTDVRIGTKSFKNTKKVILSRTIAEWIELRCQGGDDWLNNLAFTFKNVSTQPIVALSAELLIKHGNFSHPVSIPLAPGRPIPHFLDRELAQKIKAEVLMPNEDVTYSLRQSALNLIAGALQSVGSKESVREVDLDLGLIQFDYETGWEDGEIFRRSPVNPLLWLPYKAQSIMRSSGVVIKASYTARRVSALDCWTASNDETVNCYAWEFALPFRINMLAMNLAHTNESQFLLPVKIGWEKVVARIWSMWTKDRSTTNALFE